MYLDNPCLINLLQKGAELLSRDSIHRETLDRIEDRWDEQVRYNQSNPGMHMPKPEFTTQVKKRGQSCV